MLFLKIYAYILTRYRFLWSYCKNNLKILLKTYPVALSKNLSCRSIQKTYPVAQSENLSC